MKTLDLFVREDMWLNDEWMGEGREGNVRREAAIQLEALYAELDKSEEWAGMLADAISLGVQQHMTEVMQAYYDLKKCQCLDNDSEGYCMLCGKKHE